MPAPPGPPPGPTVQRIPGVRGANAYLVTTPEGPVLVDTGFPGNGPPIVAFLRTQGHEPGALRAIVLTHADPDHAGSAAELAALTGARVAIHADEAAVLAGGMTPGRAKGPWRARTALHRLARLGHEAGMTLVLRWPWRRNRWRPLTADLLLSDGDVVCGLRVLHAPGHTAGSVALLAEGGALLTGDAIFGDAQGRAHFPPAAVSLDPAQARASAERLVARGFSALYPGHGAPVLALRTRPPYP